VRTQRFELRDRDGLIDILKKIKIELCTLHFRATIPIYRKVVVGCKSSYVGCTERRCPYSAQTMLAATPAVHTNHIEGTIVAKTKEDGEKKVSQRAMVQAALDHCGSDAKPSEMKDFIMEKFSTDLAPNIISNYKSQIKREGHLPGASSGRSRKGGSLNVEDCKVVRDLVLRLGAQQVKQLVDVVG
jgi:hypothetical protein